jgi:small GTP-binding protein
MGLSVGIVGLPNVGKSTLFQAITKKQVECSNYPFCTIDPNKGVVAVRDNRADKLAELTKSAKKIFATVEFVDIAGLVKGANKGEGLGNKFLANIREVDAIIYVLRCFAVKELEVLLKAKKILEQGTILNKENWEEQEKKILNKYEFLTLKPVLYLLNGSENEIRIDAIEFFKKNNLQFLSIDILTESEAGDIEPEERKDFGLPIELKIDDLIKESYKLLHLITFFTTGPDETRAWTLEKNKKAPEAGGVIHSDFEKLFIRADVINWQELVNAGGFAQAREKGLIRAEGKDYLVQDGDVIEIKSGA